MVSAKGNLLSDTKQAVACLGWLSNRIFQRYLTIWVFELPTEEEKNYLMSVIGVSYIPKGDFPNRKFRLACCHVVLPPSQQSTRTPRLSYPVLACSWQSKDVQARPACSLCLLGPSPLASMPFRWLTNFVPRLWPCPWPVSLTPCPWPVSLTHINFIREKLNL